ncbi:hypothetical protein GYH30_027290 [Glycine max]|uniref:Uncharacterized protein n=1 Tax=Glycine max TaxID=3847 RepID=A0A0R0HQM4_SOYBN|nr:hypothetical protein GYH30_027290 [Glycine max]
MEQVPQPAHITLVLLLVKPHLTHYSTTFFWIMFCSPHHSSVSQRGLCFLFQHLCYVFSIFCFVLRVAG